MLNLSPKITTAGLALAREAARTPGTSVAITAVAIGSQSYNPIGTERALKLEIARFPVSGGTSIDGSQVSIGFTITNIDAQNRSTSSQWIGEIGFYAGTTLFAVLSKPEPAFFYKSQDVDIPVSYTLDISALPAGSVTVNSTADPAALSSLMANHSSSADAHPGLKDSIKNSILSSLTADDGTKLVKGTWFGNVKAAVSQLAAAVGATLIGWANGGTAISVGQALDILYFGVVNVRNPKFSGGAKGGGNDDTAAFEAAIATGKRVYVPADSYNIGRTLIVPQNGGIIGDGMTQTILNSKVIGGSLIATASPDGTQNSLIQDLQLNGNGLSGAQGNGHALNFIDPVRDAGAWAPQGMVVQRLWIRNFRGAESRDHTDTTKIAAAGIICVQGLQNVFRDVIVHNCGHGFYLDSTQTNKIVNCVAYLCDKAGIFTYQTVGTLIEQCDIVGNGASGTTDAAYPASDLGMANIICSFDENLTISRTKVKNTNGQAQVYLKQCYGTIISENWLRSDIDQARTIVVNNGLKALNCPGLKIKDNTFSCVLAAGTIGQPVKAKHVNLVTPSQVEGFSFTFTGNVFVTQPGLLTEYSLCVESTGASTNCEFFGCIIDANRFGTPLVVNSPIVHDDDILVRNCSFTYSRITNNVHYAQTNVTRTCCINGVNLSAENNNTIQQNLFKVNGGTITTKYSGLLYPTRRVATKTYDPPSLAPGASATTTFTMNNTLVGEVVVTSFNKPLQGVQIWAEVTSSVGGVGTVTVTFLNPAGAASAVDLPSGTLLVTVDRNSSAEVN